MKISINIYYKGKGAQDFAREMLDSGLVERIRAQEGNISYEYFIPFDRKNCILLVDEWTSQKALDIHHQSAIMDEIIRLRDKYDVTMEVHKYKEIENSKDKA